MQDGISIRDVSNMTVEDNVIIKARGAGIEILQTEDSAILQNEVSESTDGIQAFNLVNLLISDNDLSHNQNGFWFWNTLNGTSIEGNLIHNNTWGGWFRSATNGTFTNNIVEKNIADAVTLRDSRKLVVTTNVFHSNQQCTLQLWNSTDILIHSNSIFNSSTSACDDLGIENQWNGNYTIGGNYWEDYRGVDECKGPMQDDCTGSDGFGDLPYVIDDNSSDLYPLCPCLPNALPSAIFTVNHQSAYSHSSFHVIATNSSDSEDKDWELEFRWDWEGDGFWDTSWETKSNANHKYNYAGNYTILMEVRDTMGGVNQSAENIEVLSEPPVAIFSVNNEFLLISGDEALLDASSSRDTEDEFNGIALFVRWDLNNDGVWDTDWTTQTRLYHTFDEPGTYFVRLQVKDSDNLTTETSREIIVYPPGDNNEDDVGGFPFVLVLIIAAIIVTLLLIAAVSRKEKADKSPGEGKKFDEQDGKIVPSHSPEKENIEFPPPPPPTG